MELNKKNIVILCLGAGILIFFMGIGLNVLLGPTTESYKLPQQISSVVKLSGMGLIVISMIIGGFFVENMDKDTKSLLLIFGIILLLLNILLMSIPGAAY